LRTPGPMVMVSGLLPHRKAVSDTGRARPFVEPAQLKEGFNGGADRCQDGDGPAPRHGPTGLRGFVHASHRSWALAAARSVD
jgi:hypothetical protein